MTTADVVVIEREVIEGILKLVENLHENLIQVRKRLTEKIVA